MATMQVVYTNDKPYTFSAEIIDVIEDNNELMIVTHKHPRNVGANQFSMKSETVLLKKRELVGYVHNDCGSVKAEIFNPHNQQRFWNVVSVLPTPENKPFVKEPYDMIEDLESPMNKGKSGIVPSFLRRQAS